MSDWLSLMKNAKKSCIQNKNLKKVHYHFDDDKEMIEEYNMDTNVIVGRAFKSKTQVNGEEKWLIELGDAPPNYINDENLVIKESCTQPFISKRATKLNLEWRIRNLPYPIETYSVTVDEEKSCLVIRTTNKKYFKILTVPEVDRLHLPLQQDSISISHKFNTLIISYKKPKELLDFEQAVLQEVQHLNPMDHDINQCNPN